MTAGQFEVACFISPNFTTTSVMSSSTLAPLECSPNEWNTLFMISSALEDAFSRIMSCIFFLPNMLPFEFRVSQIPSVPRSMICPFLRSGFSFSSPGFPRRPLPLSKRDCPYPLPCFMQFYFSWWHFPRKCYFAEFCSDVLPAVSTACLLFCLQPLCL